MTEIDQNATLRAGDAHTLSIAITTDEDLTGATAYWYAARRLRPSEAEKVIQKSTADGVTVTSVGGVWTMAVALASADTAALDGGFHHEARVILASGEPAVVAVGRLSILPTFTPTA